MNIIKIKTKTESKITQYVNEKNNEEDLLENRKTYIDNDFLDGKSCYELFNIEYQHHIKYGNIFKVSNITNYINRMKIIYAYIAHKKYRAGIDYNNISNEEKLLLNSSIVNVIKYLTYESVEDYLELYNIKELKELCYLNHIPDYYVVNKKYKGNWALCYKKSISFSKVVFCYYFYSRLQSKLYRQKDILSIIYTFI